jgi:hypothetical protein
MENSEAIAKINDRLRRAMSMGQLTIELSELVAGAACRPEIIKAVREFKDFDPEIDASGDHSIGILAVSGEAYIFRFSYGDERYDYSKETGKRTLSIFHVSEFRSLKLGRQVQTSARKLMDQGVG